MRRMKDGRRVVECHVSLVMGGVGSCTIDVALGRAGMLGEYLEGWRERGLL